MFSRVHALSQLSTQVRDRGNTSATAQSFLYHAMDAFVKVTNASHAETGIRASNLWSMRERRSASRKPYAITSGRYHAGKQQTGAGRLRVVITQMHI